MFGDSQDSIVNESYCNTKGQINDKRNYKGNHGPRCWNAVNKIRQHLFGHVHGILAKVKYKRSTSYHLERTAGDIIKRMGRSLYEVTGHRGIENELPDVQVTVRTKVRYYLLYSRSSPHFASVRQCSSECTYGLLFKYSNSSI